MSAEVRCRGGGVFDGDGSDIGDTAYAETYLYTGREWDAERGVYYYRARAYHQATGVFLSRDPAGVDALLSGYSYVISDPISMRDPMGMQASAQPEKARRLLADALDTIKSDLPNGGAVAGDIWDWLDEGDNVTDDDWEDDVVGDTTSLFGFFVKVRLRASTLREDAEEGTYGLCDVIATLIHEWIHGTNWEWSEAQVIVETHELMLQFKICIPIIYSGNFGGNYGYGWQVGEAMSDPANRNYTRRWLGRQIATRLASGQGQSRGGATRGKPSAQPLSAPGGLRRKGGGTTGTPSGGERKSAGVPLGSTGRVITAENMGVWRLNETGGYTRHTSSPRHTVVASDNGLNGVTGAQKMYARSVRLSGLIWPAARMQGGPK